MPRQREARSEAERKHEGRPQRRDLLRQPAEEEQRRDERVAEGHRDERGAEARAAGDWREIAVDEAAERQLKGVLCAEQEREDPDLEHADDAGARDPVEAPLRRDGPATG